MTVHGDSGVANCAACGVDTAAAREWYRIHDHLWEAITPDTHRHVVLCVGCVESLLGRDLHPDDFDDCPLNALAIFFGSLRLQRRLGVDDLDDDSRLGAVLDRAARLDPTDRETLLRYLPGSEDWP